MGAGSRLTLLSFLGIMVVLLVLLAFWAGQTDYALLHAGLSPEEAATVSDKLRDDKVPFHYEASRGAIYVPASRVDAVKLSLATMGIPHSGDTAFDKFDKQAFGTTEYVQKINFVRAQEASLAHTIMAIEGVESARVKLAIPDEEVFIREKREAKASVTVTLRRDKALSGENVNAIKYLVASSVPKLDARNVTVVDSAGRMLSRPQDANDSTYMSDEQLNHQRQVERDLTNKVQELLDPVVGPGKSVVKVTAQLNFQRTERSSEKMDPDTGVLTSENSRSEDTIGRLAGPGGVPGVASNIPAAGGTTPPALAAEGSLNTNSKKQKGNTNQYHFDTVVEHTIAETGTIKRLSVAVLVAAKAPAAGAAGAPGKTAAVARTTQEMQALTDIVNGAVGFSKERGDMVSVKELPFAQIAEAPAPPPAPEKVGPWTEWWQSIPISERLAFIGIVLMLAGFWWVFRKTSVPAQPPAQVEPARTFVLPSDRHVTVEEDVKELVTRNSSRAVNIIRSMMR